MRRAKRGVGAASSCEGAGDGARHSFSPDPCWHEWCASHTLPAASSFLLIVAVHPLMPETLERRRGLQWLSTMRRPAQSTLVTLWHVH